MDYIIPASIIAVSILIGLLLEKMAVRILKKLLHATKWEVDKNLSKSFHGIIITTFICLGLYTATMQVKLEQNVHDTLKAILLTLLILLVTSGASRMATAFIKLYQGKYKGMVSSISIFTNIIKLTIFTIGLLIVLQTLGISITPILTALGVGGLAVALALKDSLANLFAGLLIIASRQLRIGDYIKVGNDAEGHVVDINWRSTVLKTLSHNEVIIPNAKAAEAVITNFSRPQNEISVTVTLPVSYANDFSRAQSIALDTAKKVVTSHPAAIIPSDPSVKFAAFNDTSAAMNVSVRCKTFAEQYALKDELYKKVHAAFAEGGIKLP